MNIQRISRCAIVYDINGLYRLLNNKGETLFHGNLQSCEYHKDKIDKEQGYHFNISTNSK